jgi:phage-related protein
MLDNLKLGYGGTKTEMERLLKDAEKISGVKYDLSSYADVTQAIHVMQESMGIAGTTAKEASETIQGSIGALKGSFQNLLVGLGSNDEEMDVLVDNTIQAFKTVADNIAPVVANIADALPWAINGAIIAVRHLLPDLLKTATGLFEAVLEALLELLPELIPAAVDAVMTIAGALVDNLPLLIKAAFQLVTALVQGIADSLPALIPAAVDAVVAIAEGLIDNLPLLVDAALDLACGAERVALNNIWHLKS